MNMENLQTCMNSNQIKASISCSSEPNLSKKHDEFMIFCNNMSMHVQFNERQLQNFKIKACMHELGSNSTYMDQFKAQSTKGSRTKHEQVQIHY